MSACPLNAAQNNGVQPEKFWALMSAPWLRSMSSGVHLRQYTAWNKAVQP